MIIYDLDPLSQQTLVLGTAAASALAGVGQLRRGRSRGSLRTVATVANWLSMLWAGLSVYAVTYFVLDRGMGAFIGLGSFHRTLLAGGWTYIIANALILAAGCTAIGRKNPRTRRPKHN